MLKYWYPIAQMLHFLKEASPIEGLAKKSVQIFIRSKSVFKSIDFNSLVRIGHGDFSASFGSFVFVDQFISCIMIIGDPFDIKITPEII